MNKNKKNNTTKENSYKSTLIKSRIFEIVNFSFRLIFFAFCILIPIYLKSTILFFIIIAAYILLKLLGKLIKFIIKTFYFKNTNQEVIEFESLTRKRKTLGKFKYKQVHEWIIELCKRMNVKYPKTVSIYDTKQANAFAEKQKYWIFFTKNNIHLYSNLFHILSEDELKAIIAHELGHFKNYRKNISILWIIPPLIFFLFKYIRLQEYLADYYAAKFVGTVPTANALIKIYHRGHMINEVLNRIYFLQQRFNFSNIAILEMNKNLEKLLPHNLKDEKELIPYVEKIIDSYFSIRSEKFEGIGKEFGDKYKKAKRKEIKKIRDVYDIVDWKAFDNRIKDNFLDEEELSDLYKYLKGNLNARFFISYIFQNKKMERFSSHPSLRDRIIFITETNELINKVKI